MSVEGVEIRAPAVERSDELLTPEALRLLAELERAHGSTRQLLLRRRAERQSALQAGDRFDFLPATRSVREADWRVAPLPADLQRRWVEITGPTDRKMIINALNSGADVFMADFEDANTPSWHNMLEGQANLVDAVAGDIELEQDGRRYRLEEQTATLLVRPRGWHLEERHLLVDGRPISASLFDFGLYCFHNARRLVERGSAPYFYLPKLESHLEARLWNEVILQLQQTLGLPRGTIKATVLVETLPAAFEMDEILYELRDHAGGLNAGRWDYIFSSIKKLRDRPEAVLPDRALVTMTVPFMRAYTELLVKTCHRRGAFALGGMAAFIPSRRDPRVNEVALPKVREDKLREAGDGFDGTWVAHPDLVETARAPFAELLGDRANQLDRQRPEVQVSADDLLDLQSTPGEISEQGLRLNVGVGIQYIASWLRGQGAAAINNLMEDAATAEISRSQVWQWVRHGARLHEGPVVTSELVREIQGEELARLREAAGAQQFAAGRFTEAAALFEQVALGEEFVEFLTLPAYELID